MARRGKVAVSISADNSGLKRGIRDSEGQLGRLQRAGVSTSRGFSAAFKTAGGVIAGAAVADQIRQTIVAAQEAEVSQRKMAAQLKATGISYRAHAAEIDRVIQKTSKLAGLDDEDLQDAFTAVVRSTGSVKTALHDMSLVADVARAKHMDVAKAGELVAKVHAGNVGALKRMGIAFQPVTAAQDKLRESTKHATVEQTRAAKEADKTATAQKALGLLQGRVKGQAEAYGKTSAGAADRFRVAVENLRESVGAKLLPIITRLTTKAADFVNQMQDGTGAGGRFADKLKEIADRARPIVKFFTDHPKLIAIAVAAWVAYRVAAAAAMAATRLKALGMFKGLARPAAVAGAEAGTAFGGAATTSGAATMRKGKWSNVGRSIGGVIGLAAGAVMAAQIGIALGKAISKWMDDHGVPHVKVPGLTPLADKILGVTAPPGTPRQPKLSPNRQPIEGDLQPPRHAPKLTTRPPRAHTSSVVAHAPRAHTSAVATAARGPARISGATTDKRRQALAVMEAAWKAAAPSYGRAGAPMPRVKFTGDNSPLVGTVWNSDKTKVGSAVVYWPDWMTDWLLGLGKPGDRDAAFSTLIHEWAHIFQVAGLSDDDAEGGAQAFARRVAPQVAGAIGLTFSNVPFKGEQYQGPISRVKRSRGQGFIMSGQFRGGAAKATTARAGRRVTAHPGRARQPHPDDIVAAIEGRANQIDAAHVPYQWGGGHGGRFTGKVIPMDCSGAVSAALGIDPRVSGDFATWGSPGDGGSRGVTIYANRTHVLMKINGRFWGTSRSNPGGGPGWIDGGVSASYLQGFTARHMEGAGSAADAAGGSSRRRMPPHAALEHGQSGVSKGVGARLPKGAPDSFYPALTSGQVADLAADPETNQKARNMRLFAVASRINAITAALTSGRAKSPATRQRLLDELRGLYGERDDLLTPIAPATPAGDTSDSGAGDSGNQELIDAQNAAAEAARQQTAAVNALKDAITLHNEIAQHVMGITGTEAIRAMADFLNGQIGGVGYEGRALTAGDGSLARF